MRDFDPIRLGGHEADAWVYYYLRRWPAFLRSAVGMVRVGFKLSYVDTLRGAWLVLRANQLWAPYPDNDPDGARHAMRRFYAIVARVHHETFDVTEAARLEVEWWRVHRGRQHGESDFDELVEAVADLYAYVYRVPVDKVREAARLRSEAMEISDRWVAGGCDPSSPDIIRERNALIEGYTILRRAVS